MKKIFIILFVIVSILLSSCDSNYERRQIFEDKMIVLKDPEGRCWSAQHNLGDTYFLYRIHMEGCK